MNEFSEKESVKFTINIKTEIPSYTAARGQAYSVVRSYSDFVWLHTSLSENELYYGLLIPPKPYKPDFESSRLLFYFKTGFKINF